MMQFLYIVIVILILSLFVITHELGHFMAARSCGVAVKEFSVGMGPLVFQKTGKKNGVQFSLRLFPLGGFCTIKGEQDGNLDPDSLYAQSAPKKIFIFAAGAIMNLFLSLAILLSVTGTAKSYNLPVLDDLMDGVPFRSEEGLLPGDRFVSINGHAVWHTADIAAFLDRDKPPYEITVLRDGELVTNNVWLEKGDYVYDGLERNGYYGFIYDKIEDPNTIQRIQQTTIQAVDMARIIYYSIHDLATGRVGLNDLSGMVGIVDAASSAGVDMQEKAESDNQIFRDEEIVTPWKLFLLGLGTILYFMVLVGINLAVVNLLPLPALDGGHILFVIINAVLAKLKLKTISVRQEQIAHAMAMMVLCCLMLILLANDVIHIVWRAAID